MREALQKTKKMQENLFSVFSYLLIKEVQKISPSLLDEAPFLVEIWVIFFKSALGTHGSTSLGGERDFVFLKEGDALLMHRLKVLFLWNQLKNMDKWRWEINEICEWLVYACEGIFHFCFTLFIMGACPMLNGGSIDFF